jgi:hypothetical protein
VRLQTGAVITGGASGTVEVLGRGGASSGSSNYGVGVTGSGSQIHLHRGGVSTTAC